MKKIDLEEKKRLQVEIMLDVLSFCEKNNLRCYPAYGTLIGVVRHKGYIPWDDDIDLMMPREDYNTFFNTYKSKDYYKAVEYSTTEGYMYSFGKVMDKRTVLSESVDCMNEISVNADIFPLDNVTGENDIIIKYASLYRKMREVKYVALSKSRNPVKNVFLAMLKAILLPFSVKRIVGLSVKNAQKRSNRQCEYYNSAALGGKINRVMPKLWFSETVEAYFEGHLVHIPKEYDKILSSIYGNYMELPSEEDRVSHHSWSAYWI